MREVIKLAVVLTGITAVAGFALAFFKQFTAPQIEYNMVRSVKAPAVAEVFADVKPSNDPVADRRKLVVGKDKRGRDVAVFAFPAKKDGKVVAVAIETFGVGYHDGLGVMTALGTDGDRQGKIIKIAITSHAETPGKGDKVAEPKFREKFAGLASALRMRTRQIRQAAGTTKRLVFRIA